MSNQIVIAGVDEAGRGPLSGPVFAAAVILNPASPISGLTDSKKLTPKKREALFDLIQQEALCYSIASASVEEIDTINILQASLLAMKRAVELLSTPPDWAYVDGNQKPPLAIPIKTIIGGDLLEPAISAASILAKVARDRLCLEHDAQYPQYGFAKHKGYGTKTHMAALEKYGPCEHHRKSFAPVAKYLSETCY